jgi:hypothetical protein
MLTKKLLFASLLSVSGLMTKAQSTTTVNDFGKTASFQVDIQPDAKSTAFRLVVLNPKKKSQADYLASRLRRTGGYRHQQ